MSEHPKVIIALQLANASVISVNSENLHVMREGLREMKKDVERLLREKEDTEARHAAEMRELKERFSEAARTALAEALKADTYASERGAIIGPILSPFILPAPDPLVEAWKEAWAVPHNSLDKLKAFSAAMQARGYEWRKIGDAGE